MKTLYLLLTGILSGCQAFQEGITLNKLSTPPPSIPILKENNQPPSVLAYIQPRHFSSGDISLHVQDKSSFSDIIKPLAKEYGYHINFQEDVQKKTPISVKFSDLSFSSAIKKLSLLAGYAAIIDHHAKIIYIAKQGRYTFKLSQNVMQKLNTSYASNNQNKPGHTSTSGILQNKNFSFNISGEHQTNAKHIETLIRSLANKEDSIHVSQSTGIISVQSDAMTLDRIHQFLQKFSDHALKKVKIKTSILEAKLENSSKFGLNWSKILSSKLRGSIQILSESNISNPTLNANLSHNSISAIIQAIEKYANLKIISQSTLVSLNNTPAQIFDGIEIPYVPEIQTTTVPYSSTGNSVQTTASASFATDGINISIYPEIIDHQNINLTIMPEISSVQSFKVFNIGSDNKITAPVRSTKNSFMTFQTTSNHTLIIGGIRDIKRSHENHAIPGILRNFKTYKHQENHDREVIILINAQILPSYSRSVLFSESL